EGKPWNQFFDELESFRREFWRKRLEARHGAAGSRETRSQSHFYEVATKQTDDRDARACLSQRDSVATIRCEHDIGLPLNECRSFALAALRPSRGRTPFDDGVLSLAVAESSQLLRNDMVGNRGFGVLSRPGHQQPYPVHLSRWLGLARRWDER